MAHGLPDYYRGVDIAYQALAQLLVRPAYGKAKKLWAQAFCSANVENALDEVVGKGMIYGGIIYLDHDSSQGGSEPRLYVDNLIIAELDWNFLSKYAITREHSYPIYLLKQDEVNFVYCAGVSCGITFEEGFKLTYDENEGGTPEVWCNIHYALIT